MSHGREWTAGCASPGERGLKYVIFACPKSGTTWMQRLLSSHPEVHCAETRLFGPYVEANSPSGVRLTLEGYVDLLKRHFHPPVDAPQQTAFYDTLLFDLVDQIARTSLHACGKKIYGEKLTPYLGTAMDAMRRLHAYDPGIAFVHLVRDGRDVAVSGAAHWLNVGRQQGPDVFEMFVRLWTEANEAAVAAENLFPRFVRVRYEDLLRNPEPELVRLLGFIGAPNDDALVRACVEAASFEKLSGGRARGEEDAGSFFRKGVAGDWKTKLSPAHVQRIEDAGGALMRTFGYQ